jgi:L-fuculose-phosphate aldolase
MDKKEIIKEIIRVSHYIYNKNLAPGKSGNISARFEENGLQKVAITRSGVAKKNVAEEDVIIIDLDGNVLEGNQRPSSETLLHLEVYKNRDDINGIVHGHPPYSTGFSMSNKPLKWLEGFGEIKKAFIPSVKYSKPGSRELAENTAEVMKNEDMVVLKNHGIVAAGMNLDEAITMAEFIEDIAKTQFVASILDLTD